MNYFSVTKLTSFVILLSVIGIGCARYPLVDDAKKEYRAVENDPEVTMLAPSQLEKAKQELQIINMLKKNGASRALIHHHAYLAQKQVEIAREMALLNKKQDELGGVEREYQLVLAQVQREEMLAAERRALEARQEAELARQRTEVLADRISELEGERTKRGVVLNLRNVLFGTGNAKLKPGSEENLSKLARFLLEYPERKILVEGFTDDVGPESVNQRLSLLRAEVVKQALIEYGIAPYRIQTRGYGESYPIAENTTEAGRQQNRRVEVVISDETGSITARRPIDN